MKEKICNNGSFIFNGKKYNTFEIIELEKNCSHCEKCAFRKEMECEYELDIPFCDVETRDDGKLVYFKEGKNENFS